MTATIELNDRLVNKAKKLTGITEDSKMLNKVLKTYINAEEIAAGMLKYKDSGIWGDEGKQEQE
jgi:hypothetical protein